MTMPSPFAPGSGVALLARNPASACRSGRALADTFPVTLELVADGFFRAMAGIFVRSSPPASVQLVEYGNGLPAFIEQFAPAHSLPCLADVARLEMLPVRAFSEVSVQTLFIYCALP